MAGFPTIRAGRRFHRRKNLRVPMRDEITPAATPSMAAKQPDDTEGAAVSRTQCFPERFPPQCEHRTRR